VVKAAHLFSRLRRKGLFKGDTPKVPMPREPRSKLPKLPKCARNYRLLVLEMLGPVCAKCSFDDVRALEIDHVEPYALGPEPRNKRRNSAQDALRAKGVGFQVLCANCHRIKTHEDIKRIARTRMAEEHRTALANGACTPSRKIKANGQAGRV